MDNINYKTDNAILTLLLEQQEIEEVKQGLGIVSNGDENETHAGKFFTTDDLITLRNKATVGLGSTMYTGIVAKKYDGLNDGQLVFDADGYARVGDIGSLQMIATREDAPLNSGIAYYDNITRKFKTKDEFSLSVGYAENATKLGNIEASRYLRNDINNPKLNVTGGLTFTLEADSDNSNESDNVALILSQDGGGTTASLGLDNANDLSLHYGSNQVFRYDESEDVVLFNSTVHSSAKFNKHLFYSPDTSEDLLNLRRYGANHTLLNIMSPPQASWGKAKETTIALVRGDSNEYFMDIYNMDYGDADAGNYLDYGDARMGIRLQKRGEGHYTPFNLEYSAGAEEYPALTIQPNETESSNHTSVEVNRLLANYDTIRRFETVADGTLTSGNSLISGYIKNSGAFIDGFSGQGWSLGHGALNDSLTVGDLTVRRSAKFYELIINKIRSGNGSYWFSDGAKVNRISDEDATGYTLELDEELGNPFALGQKVRCQVWNGSGVKFYEATISWGGNATYPNYIKLNKAGFIGDLPEAGDEIVRISGGAVYITSSDNNSPYIDVVYDMVTKARFGKLNGINDPNVGGALSGYGFYCDNVYLKGIMKLSAGSSISFNDVTDTDALNNSISTAQGTANKAVTDASAAQSTADDKINESQAAKITKDTVTADYVNGLECSFNKGKIGNFEITSSQIRTTNCSWGGAVAGSWMKSGEYMIYKSTSEYIKTYYTSSEDWGIYGRNSVGRVFQIGSTNRIAGFQFDNNYIWSGTKQTSDTYALDGASMTIGSGAIRAKEFYISAADGSAHFKGVLDAPSGTIGGFETGSTYLKTSNWDSNNINGRMRINSSTGEIEVRGASNRVSYISHKGIFANDAGQECWSVTSGMSMLASVVGLGFANVAKDEVLGIHRQFTCGVYGAGNNSGTAPTYGVFCDGTLWTRNVEVHNYVKDVSNSDANALYLDTNNYGYFSLFPTVEDAYIRLNSPETDEAREITIFNRDNSRQIHIRWSLIHSDNFVLQGGGCITLVSDKNEKYNNGTATTRKRGWVIKSYFDNGF